MADLAFVAELDAAKFHRELDRMDSRTRESEKSFGRMETAIGQVVKAATLFKAISFANSSIEVFAKQSDQARASVEALNSAWTALKSDIGSDLVGLLPGPEAIDALAKARNAIVDTLADAMGGNLDDFFGGGNAAGVRDAQSQEVAMQREFARQRRRDAARNGLMDSLDSDLAQQAESPEFAETVRNRRRMREIRQNPDLDANSRIEAQQKEEQYHRGVMARIEEKRRAEEQERLDKNSDRFGELAAESQRLRIEADMINAKGVEAEIDRMRLGFSERIMKIQKDDLLTQEQKDILKSGLGETADASESAIRAKFARDEAARQKYTVLELAGVADAATRRQIIGSGSASGDPQTMATEKVASNTEKSVALQEKSNDLSEATLRSIDDFVRGAGVARYGR